MLQIRDTGNTAKCGVMVGSSQNMMKNLVLNKQQPLLVFLLGIYKQSFKTRGTDRVFLNFASWQSDRRPAALMPLGQPHSSDKYLRCEKK